ncbi:MAG: 3-phosphoshikimate 1-carboxyvinyltransferase [Phycisphaerales bacterium]|nr:3-phosphoshikimate 1-carboxyvinyltransferase [Phycisphaerales bacterium]
MLAALRTLGCGVDPHPETDSVVIRGVGGRLRADAAGGGVTLSLNNAGTATRFLTAAAALADGPVVVDGNARMRQRPLGELLVLLRGLGVGVEELGTPGCVPVRISPPPGGLEGGELDVPTTLSSQYASALLLVAPWTRRGVTLRFVGEITSPSYLTMTADLLARLGADVRDDRAASGRVIAVGPTPVEPFEEEIEPDASGATYFWAAAALFPGARCETPGLHFASLQADARFPNLLASMGARLADHHAGRVVVGGPRLRGIDADLFEMPDAAMTLAAAACFAEGPTTIRGLRTLRVKETDRLEALRTELSKIGARVEIRPETNARGFPDETLVLTPPPPAPEAASGRHALIPAPVVFHTYDDHRMAMALALIGLRRPGVSIADPGCVAKTYPTYWKDFARLYEGR